ncbi:MAG: type II secretion system GspH family protein [Nitrospirota bacterium]|nr:type II secretion system GspH family protein [Nitrospirota bacterium]
MPRQDLNASSISLPGIRQGGFSLIAVIGILAVITIGLSLVSPAFIKNVDRRHQETERLHLQRMADGIQTYLKQNKTFPPSLNSLVPDYVPFSATQLANNAHGFPRYYAVHPTMAGFTNRIGLTPAEVVDTRFLLITNLTQDAAPLITTPAEFETWWTMDETVIPNLHIYRRNVGHLFYSLTITPEGNGASFFISMTPATDSGGGLLPTHSALHLVGTIVGFDEAATYSLPNVQFVLTTNTAYWFDPFCPTTKQWNPLDPNCGSFGTVRDEFTIMAYNGNNGGQNWVNDWQESGEADGPTSGKMQVVANPQCAAGNCFQLGGGGGGSATSVSREANLTGAATATLTFSYLRTAGSNGGNIKVQASGDGGASWTNLQTYTMNGSDASQVPQSFDMTAFIAANTQIQFVRSGNVSRFLLVDNIEISWN